MILNIETSTTVCSVALGRDGAVIQYQEVNDGYSHAENLANFINEVLNVAGFKMADLDAVAISKGPGSYTGLRIGVSTAKGICYGLGIPLLSVETLLALSMDEEIPSDTLKCPMLDARRDEVYCAVIDHKQNYLEQVQAKVIDEASFLNLLESNKVSFFGNGANKCKDIITHYNAIFIDKIEVSASKMVGISHQKFINKEFEDVAYFEPYYLKEFVATIPKKR